MAPSDEASASEASAREAFHALYRAHVGYVWNSVRRLGVPERDVEDVTHDTMFAVYRKLADFDPTGRGKKKLPPHVQPGPAKPGPGGHKPGPGKKPRPDEEEGAGKGGPQKKVRLSDYRGKKNVVLAFYPAAFTPV